MKLLMSDWVSINHDPGNTQKRRTGRHWAVVEAPSVVKRRNIQKAFLFAGLLMRVNGG